MSSYRDRSSRDGEDTTVRQLIAIGIVLTLLAALVIGLTLGVATSAGLAGHGWQLPPLGPNWIGRALTGKPTNRWFAGYPGRQPVIGHVWIVWAVAVVVFVLIVAGAVWVGLWARRWFGGQNKGMASSTQVEQSTGLRLLRDAGKQIRPDLSTDDEPSSRKPVGEVPAPRPYTGPQGDQPWRQPWA